MVTSQCQFNFARPFSRLLYSGPFARLYQLPTTNSRQLCQNSCCPGNKMTVSCRLRAETTRAAIELGFCGQIYS